VENRARAKARDYIWTSLIPPNVVAGFSPRFVFVERTIFGIQSASTLSAF